MTLKEVDRALEKHSGDRRMAAAELGLSPLALKDKIHNNPALKEKWALTVDGEVPSCSASKPIDNKLTGKVDFEKALENCGMTSELARRSVSFSMLYHNNCQEVLNIAGGGMAVNLMQLQELARSAAKRLEEDEYAGEFGEEKRRTDATLVLKAAELFPRTADALGGIAVNMAKARKLLEESKKANLPQHQPFAHQPLRAREDVKEAEVLND